MIHTDDAMLTRFRPSFPQLIYFVDDLNMAALDNYGTASNISLMRQHAGYGHIYDLNKLSMKVLLNTQYLAAMNPTAGSFVINPRLQRLFATFAVGFPSSEALNTIYATFLLGHLSKFGEEVQEVGKRLVQAALQLHKRVMATVSSLPVGCCLGTPRTRQWTIHIVR